MTRLATLAAAILLTACGGGGDGSGGTSGGSLPASIDIKATFRESHYTDDGSPAPMRCSLWNGDTAVRGLPSAPIVNGHPCSPAVHAHGMWTIECNGMTDIPRVAIADDLSGGEVDASDVGGCIDTFDITSITTLP